MTQGHWHYHRRRHMTASTELKTTSALSVPAFRRFFYAICSATLAVWLVRFLIGWMAWDNTASAFWVGIASAALMLPTLVLSPVFGVISDRINPIHGMMATALGNMLICLIIAIAQWLDQMSMGLLIITAFGFGCVTAAQAPMRLSTVPQLVQRQQLPSAIGISAVTFNTARILGPTAGAVLLTMMNTGWIFVIAAGLFVTTAGIIATVSIQPRVPNANKKSMYRDLMDGLVVISQRPDIRMVLLLTAINGMVARTVMELLPAVTGMLADGSASALATLTASAGVGSIMGGVLISRQSGQSSRLLSLLFIGLIGSELALMTLNWANNLSVLIPIVGTASLLMTVSGTCSQALLQMTATEEYRGRVMSIWTVVAMGSPAIGALLSGALADWIGIEIVISGTALCAFIATLLLSRQRQRWFQETT